jgi:phosphoribosyl 1,2-cyclic phosphate phosphodiesterase
MQLERHRAPRCRTSQRKLSHRPSRGQCYPCHVRVTILGTGTSHGVPVIGCGCGVCRSTDPRNQRSRASAVVQANGATLLLDTSTEMRLQALQNGIERVDAVLYTHFHADHVSGLDDLKAFNAVLGGTMPCYGNASTEASLRERYAYAFAGTPWIGAIPQISFEVVTQPFRLLGLDLTPVQLQHGKIESCGWRIGNVAYLTDTNGIPPQSYRLLRGLELMILDALRLRPHPTHFSVSEALAVIDDLKPRRALLTHLTHEVDHATVNAELPAGVALAYDGQVVHVS